MPKEQQRKRFQIKNLAFVGWVTVAVLVVMSVGAFFGVKFALKNKADSDRKEISVLDDLKYDIIIRAHQPQSKKEEESDIYYSTQYYYVLINSQLKEQYNLTYNDVLDNDLNGYDTLSFSSSKVDQFELDNMSDEYERTNDLKSVRKLIDSHVKENYIVTVSDIDLIQYNFEEDSEE